MKPAALSFVFASFVLAAGSALAQSAAPASSAQPQLAPAPPPPGLNDPGVKASTAPTRKAAATPTGESPAELSASQLPGKSIPLPAMHDPRGNPLPTPADGRDQPPPQVNVRQDGDNTVQEYSRSGRVYMVVVTPKAGPTQTYMVGSDGQWQRENGAPKVQPVMYKILEWGKPAKTPEQVQSEAAAAGQ